MLIPLQEIKRLYLSMLQRALQVDSACSTYIFAANDTDALCALKILTTVLKSDGVQFIAVPVFSQSHLRSELTKLQQFNDSIRSLVFLNCGGMIDLTQQWFYQLENCQAQAYLLDSHRPYHHNNVIDKLNKVFVIDDGCKSFLECPTEEDVNIYLNELRNVHSDSDDNSMDSDDSEQENGINREDDDDSEGEQKNGKDSDDDDDGEEGYGQVNPQASGAFLDRADQEEINAELEDLKDLSQQEKEAAEKLEAEGENLEDQIDTINQPISGKKRSSTEARLETKQSKQQLKRQKRIIFESYYRGTFIGKCSASITYELAAQLNKDSKEMLWWRIVGFTDQTLHEKIDTQLLENEVNDCNERVFKVIPPPAIHQNAPILQDEMAQGDAGQEDLSQLLHLQSNNKEVGHIRAEPELKLMLLRHWSLMESLENSNYSVSRMLIWQEPGKKQLRKYLANLSVPLEQANQQFQYMDPALKNHLKDKILSVSTEFNMAEPLMHGYVRQFDPQTQISATDMAYSVQSLLDFPQAASSDTNSKPGEENKQNNQQSNSDNSSSSISSVPQMLFDNFWLAFDALELKQQNLPLVMKGIELAKEMQMAIVRVGVSLIDKREVKSVKTFRYTIVENSYLKDISLFQFPMALTKLAHFTDAVYRAKNPKAKEKEKPFVISVKNTSQKTTLVVAVMGQALQQDRNDFGQRFRNTAKQLGVKSMHDGFDAAMIELRNEDWKMFIQTLAQMDQQ